ncbi:alpha/beta fold hydrolase [Nocardia crassostreae]|uniref:alpha/beta fold hydrolase n=1 Tax=Nocardia crassostreae TaxID=53428 RepID=UPI00082B6679|nr:alpha/beta fold hydrolase [Nocardia crassostreae]
MPYVSTDGARVFYTDSGDRARPAVVLGHGFFMDLSMFAPQAEYLEATGFRVLCWDARGHGGTTVTDRERPIRRRGGRNGRRAIATPSPRPPTA